MGHSRPVESRYDRIMFRLVTTVRRGSASGMAATWPHYGTIEAARLGAAELFREERVVRVMVVHNTPAGGFVEWIDK
jgi:hypothetical protein